MVPAADAAVLDAVVEEPVAVEEPVLVEEPVAVPVDDVEPVTVPVDIVEPVAVEEAEFAIVKSLISDMNLITSSYDRHYRNEQLHESRDSPEVDEAEAADADADEAEAEELDAETDELEDCAPELESVNWLDCARIPLFWLSVEMRFIW